MYAPGIEARDNKEAKMHARDGTRGGGFLYQEPRQAFQVQ